MTITTERAEQLAKWLRSGYYDSQAAQSLRYLADDRDRKIDEITRLVEQLAAAQSVITKLLNSATTSLTFARNHSNDDVTVGYVKEAIAELQDIASSDNTALREMLNSKLEEAATVCEKSDRYRGDYFAAKIRELKE